MSTQPKTASQMVIEHFEGERDHYNKLAHYLLEALQTEKDEACRAKYARQRTVYLVIARKAEDVLESMGAREIIDTSEYSGEREGTE